MKPTILDSKTKLDFNDILLEPSRVTSIRSRSKIDIKDDNGMLPIFAAPMDTVVGDNNKRLFVNKNINVCLPRGVKSDYPSMFESYSLKEFRDKFIRPNKEVNVNHKHRILIDMANGHMGDLVNTVKQAKEKFNNMTLMVGNVANPETYKELSEAGADYIRVGIGNGCFGKGSRVLMSNGFYKNIEDVKVGDYVINMYGNPVRVKKTFNNGFKEVLSVKTSMSPKNTIVTHNHEYYVGGYNKKVKDSKGYKKSITSNGWDFISSYNDNFTPLFPNRVSFTLPETFFIDLRDYAINKKYCDNYNTLLTPSYELGYIFGTFLGDGNSRVRENMLEGINGLKKSTSGSVHWSFGIDEKTIVNKLKTCIESVFRLNVTIEDINGMTKVHLYNKPFAHFLTEFSKKKNKHLPENLLVNDENYLKGVYDGLIDSDGNHGTETDKRKSFHNTSLKLVELFNIIHFKLFGELPNSNIRVDNTSKLVENSKPLFTSRLMLEGGRRKTKCDGFIINKITEYKETKEFVEVFDIEVDCDTHSFVLDNSIVHNSGCLTTQQTGVGYPMASLIVECSLVSARLDNPAKIVADGGMKTYSDVVKALGLGADYVMLGSMLNKTIESCGDNYIFKRVKVPQRLAHFLYDNGFTIYKRFRGMSTKEVQKKWGNTTLKTSEGVVRVRKVEYTLHGFISNLSDYLKSAMSYSDAKDMDEFRYKSKFNIISNNAYKRFNK